MSEVVTEGFCSHCERYCCFINENGACCFCQRLDEHDMCSECREELYKERDASIDEVEFTLTVEYSYKGQKHTVSKKMKGGTIHGTS